jgi:hypothetical protein
MAATLTGTVQAAITGGLIRLGAGGAAILLIGGGLLIVIIRRRRWSQTSVAPINLHALSLQTVDGTGQTAATPAILHAVAAGPILSDDKTSPSPPSG